MRELIRKGKKREKEKEKEKESKDWKKGDSNNNTTIQNEALSQKFIFRLVKT